MTISGTVSLSSPSSSPVESVNWAFSARSSLFSLRKEYQRLLLCRGTIQLFIIYSFEVRIVNQVPSFLVENILIRRIPVMQLLCHVFLACGIERSVHVPKPKWPPPPEKALLENRKDDVNSAFPLHSPATGLYPAQIYLTLTFCWASLPQQRSKEAPWRKHTRRQLVIRAISFASHNVHLWSY